MNLTEVVGQPPAADLLGFLSQLQGMLGNLITRNIGGHDKNGVFTFDGLPLTVCEATLTQFMNIKGLIMSGWNFTEEACLFCGRLCVFENTPHQRAAA